MEERIKAEEAELKKNKKRKMLESGIGQGKKKYSAMSARFLEEGGDDEGNYDSTSLSELKRGGKRSRDRYGRSSGEDSEEEGRGNAMFQRQVGEMDDFIVDDEEGNGSDEYEEEESPSKKPRLQKKSAEVSL